MMPTAVSSQTVVTSVTDPALLARTFTGDLQARLIARREELKAAYNAAANLQAANGIISGAEVDGSDDHDPHPHGSASGQAAGSGLLREACPEPRCKHDLPRAACSLCTAPKGRTVSRTATGALANKGRRRVKRTKHTRPIAWTPDAREGMQ